MSAVILPELDLFLLLLGLARGEDRGKGPAVLYPPYEGWERSEW